MRLYTCCPTDGCGAFQEALNFLKSYGIEPAIKYDGEHYFSFKTPRRWKLSKTKKFNEALIEKIGMEEDMPICKLCNSFADKRYYQLQCKNCLDEFCVCYSCVKLQRPELEHLCECQD